MSQQPQRSFFQRNEFMLRRLHSLTGLVPVGAFLIMHLLVNASVLNGYVTFQQNVYMIHWLDAILPAIEWLFIFLPILFHALFGFVIMASGKPNNVKYPYANNLRYTLQRATGVIAFLFIAWHVLHMHGWFHFEWWRQNVAYPLGGANFRAFNAASTASMALKGSLLVQVLYAIGILSSVFHFANGIWTFGITWGVWTSAAAQKRATAVCTGFGLLFSFVGLGALYGMVTVDVPEALEVEEGLYRSKLEAKEIQPHHYKKIESLPDYEEMGAPGRQQVVEEDAGDEGSGDRSSNNPADDPGVEFAEDPGAAGR